MAEATLTRRGWQCLFQLMSRALTVPTDVFENIPVRRGQAKCHIAGQSHLTLALISPFIAAVHSYQQLSTFRCYLRSRPQAKVTISFQQPPSAAWTQKLNNRGHILPNSSSMHTRFQLDIIFQAVALNVRRACIVDPRRWPVSGCLPVHRLTRSSHSLGWNRPEALAKHNRDTVSSGFAQRSLRDILKGYGANYPGPNLRRIVSEMRRKDPVLKIACQEMEPS